MPSLGFGPSHTAVPSPAASPQSPGAQCPSRVLRACSEEAFDDDLEVPVDSIQQLQVCSCIHLVYT
eukprot:365517-Chlamydomonas_euryale.AAC.3